MLLGSLYLFSNDEFHICTFSPTSNSNHMFAQCIELKQCATLIYHYIFNLVHYWVTPFYPMT